MCSNLFLIPLLSVALLAHARQGQVSSSPAQASPGIELESSARGGSLELPPLPRGQVSLFGGTVARLDPIRDRMVVRAFGGRDVTIDFDVRTHVVRGTTPASLREIRPGTRIYADTILKDGRIFAKTLRLDTNPTPGEARGQVTAYDAARKVLRVRDEISAQPLALRVTSHTDIRSGSQPAQVTELVAGTLVQVEFRSASDGPSSAEKVEILARPGTAFTFAGKIVVVDLRDGHLTLVEPSGDGTFEVGLDSLPLDAKLRLKEGMDVIVNARFDGRRYEAQSIEPASNSQP